jgi:hypothetical protein
MTLISRMDADKKKGAGRIGPIRHCVPFHGLPQMRLLPWRLLALLVMTLAWPPAPDSTPAN